MTKDHFEYDFLDSAFEDARYDMAQLVEDNLRKMNKKNRSLFIVELLERIDPEMTVREFTEYIEASALQVM